MNAATAAASAEDARATAPGSIAGLRLIAIVELVLFFAIASIIDLLFFDGTRFRDVQPHPFWIPVLLLSLQYGTNEGLIAALAASACLLIGNIPPQSLSEDFYQYIFGLALTPLAWLLTAVVLGEVRLRQVREREELRAELLAARREAETITSAYQRIREVKTSLEARLASELRTTLHMYDAAKAIEKLDVGEVLMGVGDLVRAIMNPQKFSLFVLSNNTLEAMLNEGWEPGDPYSRVFAPDSLLFEGIVARQKMLVLARADDERYLEGQGVLAGPLRSADTNEIVGMLKIESMGFLDFNVSTIENFRMLCDWIGTALANARRYEKAGEDRYRGETADLLTASFFEHETRFLGRLGRRLGFESSLVMVRPQNQAQFNADQRLAFGAAVGVAAEEVLRGTDLAFEHGRHGRNFAILLPGTPLANTDIVISKLDAAIRRALPEPLQGFPVQLSAQKVGND